MFRFRVVEIILNIELGPFLYVIPSTTVWTPWLRLPDNVIMETQHMCMNKVVIYL